MPLSTMWMRPSVSRCGWAFSTVTRPWVAQRVCPMPVVGSGAIVATEPLRALARARACAVRVSFSEARLPTARTASMRPSCWVATPAES